MAGILWIASYPKSGNTWLRAFLANFLRDEPQPIPINELPNFVAGDHRRSDYEAYLGHEIEDISPPEIAKLRPGFHNWLATRQPQTTLVKTHNACVLFNGQPLITPAATAGAVYVVRNPLDVAVSFAHHFQVSIQKAVEILCDENKTLPPSAGNFTVFLGSWSRHVRSWVSAPGMKLHVVRYEDMFHAPLRSFTALIRFLEQPPDRERIERAIRFSSFGELSRQESDAGFIEAREDGKARFFRSGGVGEWRRHLNKRQVSRLVEAHGPVMRQFGYLTADQRLAV